MVKKSTAMLEVTKLDATADAGFDSASDIAECIAHGVGVHIVDAEMDVCVPICREQTQEVTSYKKGRCVYVASRNLVLCPMGQVLHPMSYVEKSGEAVFHNRRCVIVVFVGVLRRG
jgi:hypothetical protein